MTHNSHPSTRRRFLSRATAAAAGIATIQVGSTSVAAQAAAAQATAPQATAPATDVIVRPMERLTIVRQQMEAALFETAPPA